MLAVTENKHINKQADENTYKNADEYTDPNGDTVGVQKVSDNVAAEGGNGALSEVRRRGGSKDDSHGKCSKCCDAHAE